MQGKQDKDEDEILSFDSLCTSILQNPNLNSKKKKHFSRRIFRDRQLEVNLEPMQEAS